MESWMTRPDQPQPLTPAEAIIPVASLILLDPASYYLFGDAGASGPSQIVHVVAAMIAVFVAWRRGHTLDSLRGAATTSVSSRFGARTNRKRGPRVALVYDPSPAAHAFGHAP
jgi:Na+:H+ antiporter, NhaC family